MDFIPSPSNFKNPDGITFDPLGLLATLPNPRADRSASRLYARTPRDRSLFLWPHTGAMLGGVLIPLKTLVDHVASAGVSRLHPAVGLCMVDSVKVSIRSNLIFSELAIGGWNGWVREALGFKSSRAETEEKGAQGLHDVYVVVLEDQIDTSDVGIPKEVVSKVWWVWVGRLVLMMINGTVGIAMVAVMVVSGILDDYWSVALFAAYTAHWLASNVVGMVQIMTFKTPDVAGPPDDKWYYAAYEREEGGIVVYKGKKLVFEKLARSRWLFNNQPINHIVHWSWMITGSTAAVCSVVCMVNMGTVFQLAFLGMLMYSTIADIVATRVVRMVQNTVRLKEKEGEDTCLFGKNVKRAEGMVKAKMAKNERFRLEQLNWVEDLRLLPDAFIPLDDLMNELLVLHKTRGERNLTEMETTKEELFSEFRNRFPINSDELKKSILEWVETAWFDLVGRGAIEPMSSKASGNDSKPLV